MAQVKHYAVYNQETNRNTSADNAVVSTQAEQEIYLPAFRAAVQQGAASSVMCSYSWINGTAACQNPYTLSTVLRQQFGYTGFVTSDWGGTHSTAASANAGLAMDMPGNDGFYGTTLVNADNCGTVSTATISTAVSEILPQMFAFGMFDKAPGGSPGATATSSAHQGDATKLAEEGTVLLKNSGSVLPLTSSDKSVAVIGADASTSPMTDGGGSAGVNSSGTVTPLQGIQAAAPAGTTVTYNNGSSDSSAASGAPARPPRTWPGPGGHVQYPEGVGVGDRWYGSKGLTPLFPFGYGLSYTTFSFSNLSVGPLTAGGAATVTATVTNTGSRSGADVAQLYVTDPSASGPPPLQLQGFQRVTLAAAASATATFPLTPPRAGHRERRHGRLRPPKLRMDRLPRHRQRHPIPHRPDHRVPGPMPGRPGGQHRAVQPDPGLHLQRHRRPAMDGGVQRHP